MVLNTDLKEIMMDHALRTISYIADIGDLVVLMARRRFVPHEMEDPPKINRTPKMICHVFESEEAQYIAQSIGQAFQVAYMEFLKANGIEDHSFVKEMDYQEVLNSQEIFGDELQMFAKKEMQKEVRRYLNYWSFFSSTSNFHFDVYLVECLERVPEKWSLGKKAPGKMVPRKILGWASRIVVCVCGMLGCDQSMRTQNSATKSRGVSAEYRGVCVCVECWDVINLWKPKTRQQTFLDSFSVLQFGACRIVRWTSNNFLYL